MLQILQILKVVQTAASNAAVLEQEPRQPYWGFSCTGKPPSEGGVQSSRNQPHTRPTGS